MLYIILFSEFREGFPRRHGNNLLLDVQSLQELTEMAQKYYDDVALPKLVSLQYTVGNIFSPLMKLYLVIRVLSCV